VDVNEWVNLHWIRFREIEHPPPVLTKVDFARRYAAGEFGNASPTWKTLYDFQHAYDWAEKLGYDQKFHLRNKVAAGATHYNMSAWQIVNLWSTAPNPDVWYCSAMAPEHRKVLQGEIVLLDPATEPTHAGMNSAGLYLMFNRERMTMRDGFNAEYARRDYQSRMHAEGTRARLILKQHMCPNSLDWLEILLDRYPGHVVEFSTYECEWGTVPGFNTIWWEVRRY